MSAVAVCTAIRANYVPYARVLAQSLRRHHPELVLQVLLADEAAGRFDPRDEPFDVTELATLGGLGAPERLFRGDPQEVVVAAKAEWLAHLLEGGADPVVFVDADALVLGDLSPLFERAARQAITLVPHQLAPSEGPQAIEEELRQLLAGTFNGGLLALADRPEARAFLDWWRERLRDGCRFDVVNGMHYDQRWLDLVPGMFGDVGMLRDPDYDTAYWNVAQRSRETCRLFHFSGFVPGGPWPVTRWLPQLGLDAMGDFAPLFAGYRAALEADGLHEAAGWEYAYGRFADGTPVPRLARTVHAELGDAAQRFGDPFACGPGTFHAWLAGGAGGSPLARLWHELWLRRPDLRLAFPDPLAGDRPGLLRWVARFAPQELAIEAPMRDWPGETRRE